MSFKVSLALQKLRFGNDYVIVAATHDTPMHEAGALREILKFLQQHFDFVRPSEVFNGPSLKPRSRPAVVFTFDDGLRSNYAVAANLLEEYDTRGVFLIPNSFVSGATEHTLAAEYQRASDLNILPRDGSIDPRSARISMSWEDVRDLVARGHTIGCHTETHCRLGPNETPAVIAAEVNKAKIQLESRIGQGAEIFCWVGGENSSYSSAGMQAIKEAGFKYGFTSAVRPLTASDHPLEIPRFQFETDWPLRRMIFSFSPFRAVWYRKRARLISSLNSSHHPTIT